MPRKVDKTGTRVQRQRGLACLEIRSRNEWAINSTRNMILSLRFFTSYFVDVDTFYLFLNWFSTRVSDDQKYLSGSRLYACINTRKFKGLDSREITSLPEIKKVIQFIHGTLFQSSPKINRMLITRPICIQWKFKKHTQFKTRAHKPYPISDQNGRNWYPISDQNS